MLDPAIPLVRFCPSHPHLSQFGIDTYVVDVRYVYSSVKAGKRPDMVKLLPVRRDTLTAAVWGGLVSPVGLKVDNLCQPYRFWILSWLLQAQMQAVRDKMCESLLRIVSKDIGENCSLPQYHSMYRAQNQKLDLGRVCRVYFPVCAGQPGRRCTVASLSGLRLIKDAKPCSPQRFGIFRLALLGHRLDCGVRRTPACKGLSLILLLSAFATIL
jgi:hypothetical protein